MLAARDFGQGLGPGAQILVRIREIDLGADDGDLGRRGAPALADPSVENGGFETRIGADDEDRVGLLDAFDARIEEIARASELRIELVSGLPAIERC